VQCPAKDEGLRVLWRPLVRSVRFHPAAEFPHRVGVVGVVWPAARRQEQERQRERAQDWAVEWEVATPPVWQQILRRPLEEPLEEQGGDLGTAQLVPEPVHYP
jgi:hypothetical protein